MFKIVSLISLILIFIIACKSSPKNISSESKGGSIVLSGEKEAQEKPKADWETKWENLTQRAKKEGKIAIYGGQSGAARDALTKAFTSKYGITVEFMTARGPEIAARLRAERRAGIYYPDLIIGASEPAVTIFKPSAFVDSIEPVLLLPEVLDNKVWLENRFPWADNDHYLVAFLAYPTSSIYINSDIVKPEEIKSYLDLLEPKWKGKIAMFDPTVAGTGQRFVAIIANYLMSVDYLKKLASQELFLARDHRLLTEWVIRGKYPIGIALDSGTTRELKSAGAPLENVIPKEGIWVSAGNGFLSLPKNAPHPNASAVFINWLLSKEGQKIYSESFLQQSAREDIPTAHLDPSFTRKPGVKYFQPDTEEFLIKQNELLKLGAEIFGHLMR